MTVRRQKTYTAQTGLVYQYYFVGKRAAIEPQDAPATEYVFDVTHDRKTVFAVSVFLREDALSDWQGRHGRPLAETEQYALAKLRLHKGFDDIPDLLGAGRRLQVDPESVDELLEPLGLV